MVELELLRSNQESTTFPVSKFPCVIGRGSRCDVRINDPGVWVEHAEIRLESDDSFRIVKSGDGSLLLNGEPVEETEIHTNDLIDLGGAKVRFRLSAVRPSATTAGDWIFWGLIVFIVVMMIALMFCLPG